VLNTSYRTAEAAAAAASATIADDSVGVESLVDCDTGEHSCVNTTDETMNDLRKYGVKNSFVLHVRALHKYK